MGDRELDLDLVTTNRQIGSLTSLRGIAAVIIVIHHFSYYTLPSTGVFLSSYTSLFRNGYLCVDLFFILSGFIMTHVYLDRFGSGVTKSNYWAYLRARFARIYPLHLVTLLFLVGLELFKLFSLDSIAFTGKFNLTALLANLFLLQAFDLNCPPLLWCDTYWNEPAWSISVEFMIYSVLPFSLFLLSKTKFKTDAIIYISTLIALLLLIKFTRGNLDAIVGIPSILRCGLECAIGIITYKVYRSDQRGRGKGERGKGKEERKYSTCSKQSLSNYSLLSTAQLLKIRVKLILDYNLVTVLAVICVTLIMHNWTDNLRGVHDWSILPAFSLLILGVANQNNGLISKLMNSPPLLYLGTISYSIYLVHWCLAELIKVFWRYHFDLVFGNTIDTAQSSIALGLFVAMVLLISALTYRYIEVPLRNWIRQQEKFST